MRRLTAQRDIDRAQYAWLAEQVAMVSTNPDAVLNVGCGRKRVRRGVNLDINPERWQPGIVGGDAHRLPFADGVFDCIVSAHLIEHLLDPAAALRDMARVLRHGGFMFHVIPDARFIPEQPRGERFAFAVHRHQWHGPGVFRSVLREVPGVWLLELDNFQAFDWSFKVVLRKPKL